MGPVGIRVVTAHGCGEALSFHGGSRLNKEGVCAVEILRLDMDRLTSLPVV